ncbi:hypothetical protein [Hyphomicrobium sp. DY-1]|uniref:hypothetical protein n=1 Tax=Hyphomicrobium sp. DY-1 TaxID=3075650 RepID=UPI0039C0CA7B
MVNYRDINALAKDAKRVQSTAKFLFALDADWTDWELDFLETMMRCSSDLSTRQAEKLAKLRDDATRYTSASGFVFSTVIERCWRDRFDLETDEDLEFIERLKSRGEVALRRGDAYRLRQCAVTLGEIEPHQPWVLTSRTY